MKLYVGTFNPNNCGELTHACEGLVENFDLGENKITGDDILKTIMNKYGEISNFSLHYFSSPDYEMIPLFSEVSTLVVGHFTTATGENVDFFVDEKIDVDWDDEIANSGF